jgi:hypothetical protein
MSLHQALAAAALGIAVGGASATAYWVVGVSRRYWRFITCYLLFILAGGGGMGIAGGSLARLSGYPRWADVVAGTLGASAVIGFNTAMQKLLRKP